MSNSDVPWAHDSSLDDAGLLRRCERRVMMFPQCGHDFSFASVDTTLSSVLPTSSGSLLDGSCEGKSEESFQSPTLTLTDNRDSTVIGNISVNRNPYQDSRRWVGQGDCCYLARCKNLELCPESSVGISLKNPHAANKLSEFGSHKQHFSLRGSPECCCTANRRRFTKHNDKTDVTSNISSQTHPIIDNLILEPQNDFKCAPDKKAKERGSASRWMQTEAQSARIYASREANAHNCEYNKQRQPHRATTLRSSSCTRSSQGSKDILDHNAELYLKKLDNVFKKLSMKRQPTRTPERMLRTGSTKEAFFGSVNKNRKISVGKRACNCPSRPATSNRFNMNTLVDEVKRTGQARGKTGSKPDIPKQENILAVSRNTVRARCPQRSDKKKQLEGNETSVSACKEQIRFPILPKNSPNEKSTCLISNIKRRSKSLSALPRCHTHTLTPSRFVPPRGPSKINSCGATVSGSKYPSSEGSSKLTRQQKEILKHIPGDITPGEIRALMKTVISIVEQRHCLKSCIDDDDNDDDDEVVRDEHESTEKDPERLSKYQIHSVSNSSNTSTSVSPKRNIYYSNKTADALNNPALLKPNCTSESSKDASSHDSRKNGNAAPEIGNKSMNYGEISRKCVDPLSDHEASKANKDFVDNNQTNAVPLASLKCSESVPNDSEFSSRTCTLSSDTPGDDGISKKNQLFKKSAIVVPYDGNSTRQNKLERQRGKSSVSQSSSDHFTPNNATDHQPCEGPETNQNRLTGAPETDNLAASRHIGWRFPLQTERESQVTITETFQKESDAPLPITCHTKVIKSESALSDGLLYFKSTNTPKKLPQREIPNKNCVTSALTSVESVRDADCRASFQQHDRIKSLSTSLINGTELSEEQRSSLLPPCPHERIQNCTTSTCQSGSHSDQKYSEFRDSELDRTINELRSKIQNSYQTPVDMNYTAGKSTAARFDEIISCSELALSHTINTKEGQDKFNKNETQVEGPFPSEATDLDALSCSADTVMTNTSFSNRIQELDEEYFNGPGRDWRLRSSVTPNRNLPLSTTLLSQNDFQRSSQYITYGNTPLYMSNDLIFDEDFTTRFSHQPARNHIQGDSISAFIDEQQYQKHKTISERYGDTSKVSSELPPPSLSSSTPRPITSQSLNFKTHGAINGSGMRASNNTFDQNYCLPHDRDKTEHFSHPNEAILTMSYRHIEPHRTLQPERPLEVLRYMEPLRNVEPLRYMEHVRNMEPPSNLKLPINLEQPSNFKVPNYLEPLNNLKIPNYLEPSSNSKLSNSLETSSNGKLLISLEPHSNMDPPSNLKSFSNLEPHSNLKPTSNLELPRTSESTILGQAKEKHMASPGLVSFSKMNAPATISASSVENFTQIKQKTESLLAEVYRKHYASIFCSTLESAETTDLASALEILQNFSPISQVDVNTSYPLMIDTKRQLASAENTGIQQAETGKSPQEVSSSKSTTVGSTNQPQKPSTDNKDTSQDNCRAKTIVPNSGVPDTKTSYKLPSTSTDKQTLQGPNNINTGNSIRGKPQSKDQTKSACRRSAGKTAECRSHNKTRQSGKRKDTFVIDVTSSHNNVYCQDKQRGNVCQKDSINISSRPLIMKTYNSTSAVPIEVKVINSEINDCSVLKSGTTKKSSPQKPSPRFQNRRKHWTPVVFCRSDKQESHDRDECPHEAGSADHSQSCIVACFNSVHPSAAAIARQQLASNIKNVRILDRSLTSESGDEKANDSDDSLQNQPGNDTSDWDYTENNNYENESAAPDIRPSAKILGELAFQLERRILDYVFGMEGSKRRRFYGYTVNNICHMMNKECKNVSGSDDAVRKSELAYRLKKLLIGLKKVGYNIKVHGDFAQQMINTYGLLPCTPDPCTIQEFGLHNANCISCLITQLACNENEATNLHILLNSLKYLSKCDGRPLFVW